MTHNDDDSNPDFWIGVLATAVGQTLRHPDEADRILRPVARSLAASPVIASSSLRQQLIHDLERKP